MFTLVQKRRYFFAISGVVIVIGLILMAYSILTTGSPFDLSNDFVGGSIYELDFAGPGADEANIRQVFESFGNADIVIQSVGDPAEERWSIRADFQDFEIQSQIQAALAAHSRTSGFMAGVSSAKSFARDRERASSRSIGVSRARSACS